MPGSVWFDSMTDGRAHLRELLDAAARGFSAGLRRDRAGFAIIEATRLRQLLALHGRHAEVVAEGDGWSIFVPGIPVAADGTTLIEATEEMVDALREYAADWVDHLHIAPDHADHWWLAQLVELSTDGELSDWLASGQLASQR